MYLEGKFAKIFEQAMRLEDTKIVQSKHAAGVVVSPQPIYDVCPMVIVSNFRVYLLILVVLFYY